MKKYVIGHEEQCLFVCKTRSDAEEIILSIAEDNVYKNWCIDNCADIWFEEIPYQTPAEYIAKMLTDENSDVKFYTYHPVLSTMMPKSNKHLKEFLHKWVETGFKYGGEDGFGLQFSINTLDEKDRNEMFRNRSLSLQEISDIIKELPMPSSSPATGKRAIGSIKERPTLCNTPKILSFIIFTS